MTFKKFIKNIFYIFSFFITTVVFSQKTKDYKLYRNGKIWIKGKLILNDSIKEDYKLVKTGVWTIYNEDKILLKGKYKNGFPSGIWKLYYADGNIQIKGKYKPISTVIIKKPNKNNLFWEWNYIKSIGVWKTYWSNGVIANKYYHKKDSVFKKIVHTKPYNSNKQKVLKIEITNTKNYQWIDLIHKNLDQTTFKAKYILIDKSKL